MKHPQFSHSFTLWMVFFGLALAVVIIIFTYRRTDKPLSRRLRATLIILRIVSIGLLLICLLEPAIIAREEVRRKANLLVLVDDSQSMSLTDAGGRKEGRKEDTSKSPSLKDSSPPLIPPRGRGGGGFTTRIDDVKEALVHKGNGLLASLADKFNIQLYQFSSDCIQIPGAQASRLPLSAEGTLTDIGKAISKAADEWRGQLTAGIILITDGGNNSGEDPVEIVRQSGMPVHTVGVGSTQMPRDIQIAKAEVNPVAYVGHILPVRAVIKSSGYNGRVVQVSLMQGNELKDSVSLTLSDLQNNEQTVDLQIKPQQEGTFNFSVTVPAAPEELTAQNNVHPFFVKVVKAKLKVLYIDGKPRWEYTFLKRALQQDPNIESTCLVTAGKGSRVRPQFPTTRKELFSYDVVVLGDISPSFFSSEQLNMINNFVEDRGGSMVVLGGGQSLGRGALRGMLPIQIGPDGARQVSGAFSPVLTQDGLRHPITRLSDDATENTAIWRDLPALTRFYEGTGIKLGATVLAKHQRFDSPVIVFQRYGEGMVLLIASDSLWRWAFGAYSFGGDDSHYRKFWSGTIRWLVSIHTGVELVNVQTDKGSYHRDEKVRITVYVYDENYAPVSDAQLKAQSPPTPLYKGGNSFPLSQRGIEGDFLKFTSDGSGRYSTEFAPNRDGHYKIEVEAHHAGKLLGKNSAEFIVQTTALEFQDTQLKEAFLRNLADISGGSYHHLKDISDLPSSIKEVSDTYAFISERSLWDNGIVLMIAVALLSAEWLLRKRRGLV